MLEMRDNNMRRNKPVSHWWGVDASERYRASINGKPKEFKEAKFESLFFFNNIVHKASVDVNGWSAPCASSKREFLEKQDRNVQMRRWHDDYTARTGCEGCRMAPSL